MRDPVFAGAALHDAVERADTEVAGDSWAPFHLARVTEDLAAGRDVGPEQRGEAAIVDLGRSGAQRR
ncbi:hypothetical protein [Kribbella sp. CA-247076]|uniref:hypothetical protein n=1 Tax=Kribbella sp. CA-247076 TaxID=3239941 RepID=UPI003D947241